MNTDWTTEKRYLPYEKWPDSQIAEIKDEIRDSNWRLGYHIQPKTGLINDPNGFSYFNGQWHLFYQSFPYGPVHGLKSWDHLVSDDLVHWKDLGLAIKPDSSNDSHGAYSGSALEVGGKLHIVYTGNVRDEKWVRHPKQIAATMDIDNHLVKNPTPLIDEPLTGYTEHFRDPQIIEHDDKFYIILGAQRDDLTGHILVYKADSVNGPFSYLTELKFTDQQLGYMIECPNLIFIDQRPVLIFCPQGIAQTVLHHDNIYPNAYVVGEKFDWDTFTMQNPSNIQNLDDGFDVYATQAFNAPDGRALSISWVGLPDLSYPSDKEGWANCYSLVKELTLTDNKMIQKPVIENNQLILGKQNLSEISPQSKIELEVASDQVGNVIISTELDEELNIKLDAINGKIEVDRKHFGEPVATDFGTSRSSTVQENQTIKAELWLDKSVFELFINDGEKVITGRVFPNGKQFFIQGVDVALDSLKLDVIN